MRLEFVDSSESYGATTACENPGGWIVTILLGIAGSFVGGFLASTLFHKNTETVGWIGSIIGAMVLLFLYRLIVGRRRVV